MHVRGQYGSVSKNSEDKYVFEYPGLTYSYFELKKALINGVTRKHVAEIHS